MYNDENSHVPRKPYVPNQRQGLRESNDDHLNQMGKSYSALHADKKIVQPVCDRPATALPKTPQPNYFQAMKRKLQTIFRFYASFGDRINVSYLKSNKLHKMLQDAGLKNTHFDGRQIDILYAKINRNKTNMDFDTFLNMLHRISESVYPRLPLEQALERLLQDHFEPLHENIITQTDLGDEETKLQEPVLRECANVLAYLQPILQKIFATYFPPPHRQFKLKDSQDGLRQRSCTETQLFIFLKDFDICPTFITKSSAYLLFSHVHDQATTFDFQQFCHYLCKVAFICYDNYHSDPVEQIEKLAFLLERMELSNGFSLLESKVQLNSNARLKLEPEQVMQLKYGVSICKSQESESRCDVSKRVGTTTSVDTKCRSVDDDAAMHIIERHRDQLMQVYRLYCGVDTTRGTENLMTGSKWQKLLKDAGLLQTPHSEGTIAHSEIDLVFAKACAIEQRSRSNSAHSNSAQSMKMTFPNFLNAIYLIALRLQKPDAVKLILSTILPLGHSDQDSHMKAKLNVLMDLLKDPQIVEMLGLLHKSILVYYRFYSGPKGLISFEKFQRFYKDFEIFPDLLPKSKVVSIFQTLSKLYQQNHANCLEIDQHMFVESLALSAMEVQTHDQATNLERICFLIERMNQSNGPQIVQRHVGHTYRPNHQTWDLLAAIKKSFPWIFSEQVPPDHNYF